MQGREREIETIREMGGTIGSSNQEVQVMIPFRNSWIKGHTQRHHSLSSPPRPPLPSNSVPTVTSLPSSSVSATAPPTFKLLFFQLSILVESATFTITPLELPDLNQPAWGACPPSDDHCGHMRQCSLWPSLGHGSAQQPQRGSRDRSSRGKSKGSHQGRKVGTEQTKTMGICPLGPGSPLPKEKGC